ncbi:putative transcriptional regulator fused phosphomethylpyrimidine kinase, involved in the thiamine biosynthesis [Halalkaliarchaeum sp. AArc-CO]|uniref:thiamine-phosphate synthase family protein n=1 Tax=unclassified Halalkaliarchaeum TaxID=2678344 RepID=UPI00217DD0BB|nr:MULTISPECIES: thiamine-phosphate synthase family protein [unclassified Halalkaliarchaeum]MDR5673508.1 thiamine-phosphate synthase family protein [Halalkaliarchaeum sp. AArc-GB]UWG49806.1 putative transcriptional regulator fused phosphomethylpyrimidine kinase, involved in the thiamine biosynthesis [Halalkaliarchaeum sp. AArc-CO]
MKFIEEIVVEEFLPTFRSMLAEELRDRGFTQHEVADALGVSQSAVSKYAHGDVATNDRIMADDRVRSLVERIGEGLSTGDVTSVQALVEAEVLIRRLEDGDLLAELHEAAMPELAEVDVEYAIHDPDGALRTTEQVLSSVRRGLRTLTNASGFAGLIPAVGSNVVECLPGAAGVDDVAAVPGRLVDVKGRATVPGEVEFGVSDHLASVLLAARESGADVRGAVNIRYDEELLEALSSSGYQVVELETGTDTPEAVRNVLERAEPDPPFVCYHTAEVGVEPIIYVFAADAPAAARVVRELL